MRRLIGALVAVVVLAIGCTSDDVKEPRPSSTPVAIEDLAPLIVANGSEISEYVDGESRTIHRLAEGRAALALSGADGDGIVVQQAFDDRSNIIRIVDDRTETIAENAGLFTTALVDGTPTIVYGTCNDSTETELKGDIVLFDVDSKDKRTLAESCGPEYGVARVSFGGGVFVASASADLTELFRFYEPSGKEIEDRPNPTKDLPYNEPPFMSDAVLSSDGSELAYLEAPDISGISGETEKRTGRFYAVVVDQESEKESARVTLPDPATQYVRLDYDGRWLVLSEGVGEPVRVVDTDADDPKPVEIGVEGVAAIKHG